MWFAAKQQTIDGVLKKTVQTSHAKSVPFLPVSKAYLLSFQRIGSKNKRPDIVCYTTTRKYRELQRNVCVRCRIGVIPLRENTGNYNIGAWWCAVAAVIPLRENTGNYNTGAWWCAVAAVIPLRENTGNYNTRRAMSATTTVIPLRENTGNYNWIVPRNSTYKLYHYEKIQGTAVNCYRYLQFNWEYNVSLQTSYSAHYYVFFSIL